MTQQDRILAFIKINASKVTTNELKRWAVNNYVGCADRRIRELVTKGDLTSRWMTDDELQSYGYKTRVRIYELPTDNGQLMLTG